MRAWFGLALVGAGVAVLLDLPWVVVGLAVFAAVVTVGDWQGKRRDRVRQDLSMRLAKAGQVDPADCALRLGGWHRGVPRRIEWGFPNYFPARDAARIEAVVAEARSATGVDTLRAEVDGRAGKQRLRIAPPRPGEATEDSHPQSMDEPVDGARERVVRRLTDGTGSVLGGSAAVTVLEWSGQRPARFRIGFSAAARTHDDRLRDDLEDKVTAMLPGVRWRALWDGAADQVEFADEPDPLAPILPALPYPQRLDMGALPLGVRDDGRPWTQALTMTHWLLGGTTRAGKGSVLWSAVRALMPGVLDGSVLLWGVDPKGGVELGKCKPVFDRLVVGGDSKRIIALLEDVQEFMEDRQTELAAAGQRAHTPRPGSPALVVVVDEFAMLTKYASSPGDKRAIERLLGILLSQGLAASVHFIAAVQDPGKDVIDMRGLLPTRMALRLLEASEVDMVLGKGARSFGARADRIPEDLRGVGYVLEEGSRRPVRVRAAYPTDADLDAMAAMLEARRRPPQQTLPLPGPQPETEREGRPVRWQDVAVGMSVLAPDEEGRDVAAVVVEPGPGEDEADPTAASVPYRTGGGFEGLLVVDVDDGEVLVLDGVAA